MFPFPFPVTFCSCSILLTIYTPTGNLCQTVNLSDQTLAGSNVSKAWENLFQSSRSVGFLIPNSEPLESHGTTQNRLEATLPKVIPACVQLLHTTLPMYILPYYLSNLVPACFCPIYIHPPHSLSLSHLASFWQLAEVCFHTYYLVTILIVLAWALLPSI
jgi:hypothetical protein